MMIDFHPDRQSSRVPVPLPEDPYEAIKQAYLVWTDIESEPFEAGAETPESPHIIAPPTCHVEELEGSGTSGVRSTSSDSIAPLLLNHLLTHTTPALVPILYRTARMAVRVLPAMSHGLSAGTSELILDTDSEEDEEVEESLDSDSVREDEGPTAEDERRRLYLRVSSRQLWLWGQLTTRSDTKSPEWSSGLFPISPSPSIVPTPISSPMISLTVSSPIASPMATPVGNKMLQGIPTASLERDVEIRDNKIEYLTNELEQVKKEKESLDIKLTGFEKASKDLDNLLGSQRSDKNKEGLPEFVNDTVTDYNRPTPSIDASKCNTSDLQSSNFSIFEHGESSGNPHNNIDDNVADFLTKPFDVGRFQYLVVSIDPYLRNNKWYQSLLRSFDQKKNNTQVQQNLHKWPSQAQVQKMRHVVLKLVEARLVKFKNQEIKFCEKIRGLEFKVESKDNRIERLTKDLEELKKEREGLDRKLTGFQSASKDLDTLIGSQRPSPSIESNSINLQNNCSSISENGESTSSILSKPEIKFVKAADSPQGNQRNWNNLKSQQLGKNFLVKNKACFNCGYFDRLSYDCCKWVEKGKSRPKNNTHKSIPPRTVFHKFDRTPMRINRPNMNVAQPKRTSFAKPTHPYVRRPFHGRSTVRNQSQVPRVPTITKRFPTVDSKFSTVKSTFSADWGNKGKAVKASACWIWRPIQNTTEKCLNCNSVSVIFKKYQYIKTQGRLKSIMAWVPKKV
nr:ubiquitin hydrolase [Tanacetum cinerariifolium]